MKITINMYTKEKRLTKAFITEDGERVCLDADDAFIKKALSEALKEFGVSPDKMQVKATLDL